MMSDDDLFSRWSRRKRAVAKEEAEEVVPVEEAPAPEDVPEDEDEAELLARLKLPLPESLKQGDDFTAFMAPGVPGFLKKRALRVLWGSNPVLANIDGLNDYDEDFTSPEMTKKIVATGYQVGRGFLRDIVKEVVEEEGEAAVEVVAEQPAEVDAPVEPPERVAEARPRENVAVEEDGEPSFQPRRMRFET